jgi:hypothetical protein
MTVGAKYTLEPMFNRTVSNRRSARSTLIHGGPGPIRSGPSSTRRPWHTPDPNESDQLGCSAHERCRDRGVSAVPGDTWPMCALSRGQLCLRDQVDLDALTAELLAGCDHQTMKPTPSQAGGPAAALASECAQSGERRQRSDLRACSGPRWHPMLCLLRANTDPAHTPLASQIQRTQLPGLRVAKRCRSDSAGCSPARLGLPVPCSGTTAGPAAFAASWLLSARPTRPWSCSATPPIGRPAGPAPAQGAGQRHRPGCWLITVETGSRRRRGLARGSAPAAGRSTGPG